MESEGELRGAIISAKDEKKLKKVVRKILEISNLYDMTEKKVRDQASSKLPHLDLNTEPCVSIVRQVVEEFLQEVAKRLAQIKNERIRKA